MVTATGLLWEAVGRPIPDGAVEDQRSCAVCGRPGTGPDSLPSLDGDDFFPPTFNDREILSSGTGRVCAACVAYYVRAGTGNTLRSAHLVVTAGRVEKADTSRMLRLCLGEDVPAPPFAATVACSYKKHLLPRARVAHSLEAFPISFELEQGTCRTAEFRVIAGRVRALREAGFFGEDLETWRPPTRRLSPQLALWRRETEALALVRGSFPYRLALRLVGAPRKEEARA